MLLYIPIGSMYGILAYIYHRNQPSMWVNGPCGIGECSSTCKIYLNILEYSGLMTYYMLCSCDVSFEVSSKHLLKLTLPKTNMHGLKIHHAWVDVFPIGHGDFPASHVGFFPHIYVFFQFHQPPKTSRSSIPSPGFKRLEMKFPASRFFLRQADKIPHNELRNTSRFPRNALEIHNGCVFLNMDSSPIPIQWLNSVVFRSNYECGPQRQIKIERQIQILKLRNVDIMNWAASPIKTLQEYPNAKHPQANPNTLDFSSLSCKAQTKMVNIFSV